MVEPILRKVLATGAPVLNLEVAGPTRKDPSVPRYWVESFFPIVGADGTPEAVGAIVVEITERKRIEQQLLKYQDKLRELATKLTLAEERVRRRIAVGVHDQIGQRLALAKLALQSLQASTGETNTSRALAGVCQDIDKVIEDTHSLTFELSNPILYEVGFEPAVESWLGQQVRDRYGIECTFEADENRVELDKETRVVLFDIVRELLTNVVKHAQAKHVGVQIRRIDGTVQTSVRDDGVGFEPSRTGLRVSESGGFGLFNIREKLDYLGGSITIDSTPGEGTCIVVAVPPTYPRNSGKDRQEGAWL
jgi:signal transduction histidine kinase